MSLYPLPGSTAWRSWLTKLLRFRPAQCWTIEGLLALSDDQGTPGRLELLDDQIASWTERSLDQWRNLRDQMIQSGLLRFCPLSEDSPASYEFSARLYPPAASPEHTPLWTEDDALRSFDALPDDGAPLTLTGPMSERERRWKARLNQQVNAAWHRDMTKEEGKAWLEGVRTYVLTGGDGVDFEWNGFRTGGFVTKKNVTNGAKRDVTGSVVVADSENNSKESHNNSTQQAASSQNRDVTNPDGSIVTNEELVALHNELAGKRVTWTTVIETLIPKASYAVCMKQALWLPYRRAESPGAVYHDACLEDWEMPDAYAEAQKKRADEEAERKRKAEQKRQQQEAAQKAQQYAEELKRFEAELTDEQRESIQYEARQRMPKDFLIKLKEYEDNNQTVSVLLRENLAENVQSVIKDRFEAWRKLEAKRAKDAMAQTFGGDPAETAEKTS